MLSAMNFSSAGIDDFNAEGPTFGFDPVLLLPAGPRAAPVMRDRLLVIRGEPVQGPRPGLQSGGH